LKTPRSNRFKLSIRIGYLYNLLVEIKFSPSTRGGMFMPILQNLKESFNKLLELNLLENFSEILKHPLSILTVIVLAIIMVVLVRAKKINFTTKLITRIAIALALAVVLDFFKIYRMPQGGSVTLGSMVPIILISLWYGAEVGMLTGMLYGIISLILGPFILHPLQVILDYPLAFLVLGTAGFFKNSKYMGTVLAVVLRFVCSVLSGVIFFAEYAPPGQSPLMYSVIYNGSYLGVELIICLVLIALLPVAQLKKHLIETAS
jgi:thiamine transporter